MVGGYIFLAGLSGAAAAISTLVDLSEGRPAADTVRRGRYLSLLAPTLGSALLVWDLHTPKRFYNMLRIAKGTSPMSIGTWILMAFSGFALGNGALAVRLGPDARPGWMRRVLRVTQVPAAMAGAGLGTYTASLLAATSTPLWAAAPRSMAARFASSSIAPRRPRFPCWSDPAGGGASWTRCCWRRSRPSWRHRCLPPAIPAGGVAEALEGGWGRVETGSASRARHDAAARDEGCVAGDGSGRPGTAVGFGVALPSSCGSLLFRVSIMAAGDESARRPEISFRFAQPENLPQQ